MSNLLSIIIPARNEAATIVTLLKRLRAVLPKAEVLIIDGGSDDTKNLVHELQKDWPELIYHAHQNDQGKGHAIRTGISLARRPYLAQIDADLQFYPEDLVFMLKLLIDDSADFICGSRFLTESKRERKSVPGLRPFGNRALSLYTTLITGQHFSDILAGIKVWKSSVTSSFHLESDHFSYEAELPIKALRKGYRVVDFPVSTQARTHGQSSVNVLKTGFILLKDIPKFSWAKLQ